MEVDDTSLKLSKKMSEVVRDLENNLDLELEQRRDTLLEVLEQVLMDILEGLRGRVQAAR